MNVRTFAPVFSLYFQGQKFESLPPSLYKCDKKKFNAAKKKSQKYTNWKPSKNYKGKKSRECHKKGNTHEPRHLSQGRRKYLSQLNAQALVTVNLAYWQHVDPALVASLIRQMRPVFFISSKG
jgi:hypothetical protein